MRQINNVIMKFDFAVVEKIIISHKNDTMLIIKLNFLLQNLIGAKQLKKMLMPEKIYV